MEKTVSLQSLIRDPTCRRGSLLSTVEHSTRTTDNWIKDSFKAQQPIFLQFNDCSFTSYLSAIFIQGGQVVHKKVSVTQMKACPHFDLQMRPGFWGTLIESFVSFSSCTFNWRLLLWKEENKKNKRCQCSGVVLQKRGHLANTHSTFKL